MKVKLILLVLTLLITACGTKEAEEKAKKTAGYTEAKLFCSSCHKLPFGDQHTAAAWPAVVKRMEGRIKAAKKKVPTAQEHSAIVSFFQKTSQ